MTGQRYRCVLKGSLLLMLVPLAASAVAFAGGAPSEPFAPAPADRGPCVMEPVGMRYRHMTYLQEARDRVVRSGSRSGSARGQSRIMASCQGCHADRRTFCDGCHRGAGVQLDCFGCHAY